MSSAGEYYNNVMPKSRERKAPVVDVPEPLAIDVPIVEEKPKPEWKLKVSVIRKGMYKRFRYEVIGVVFTLDKKEHYGTWMKKILE